jgi:hypothetical protein
MSIQRYFVEIEDETDEFGPGVQYVLMSEADWRRVLAWAILARRQTTLPRFPDIDHWPMSLEPYRHSDA